MISYEGHAGEGVVTLIFDHASDAESIVKTLRALPEGDSDKGHADALAGHLETLVVRGSMKEYDVADMEARALQGALELGGHEDFERYLDALNEADSEEDEEYEDEED